MSKLVEYLKLIPRGISNPIDLIKGYVNNSLIEHLNDSDKNIILLRRIECAKCPYNSDNAQSSIEHFEVVGDYYKTERTDKHCAFCGCPIDIRTASLESNCGIEFWNSIQPDKQLPLKWTAKK
jgi:hypothetical protein